MNDTFRYLRVLTMLGLVFAAMIVTTRGLVDWAFSAKPSPWITERHLRLSVEESHAAEYDDEPYQRGKFQTQYEKL